jgi:hypothetical protein
MQAVVVVVVVVTARRRGSAACLSTELYTPLRETITVAITTTHIGGISFLAGLAGCSVYGYAKVVSCVAGFSSQLVAIGA